MNVAAASNHVDRLHDTQHQDNGLLVRSMQSCLARMTLYRWSELKATRKKRPGSRTPMTDGAGTAENITSVELNTVPRSGNDVLNATEETTS